MRLVLGALIGWLLAAICFAGTPGSFRGVLREGANVRPGWMYIESRNEVLRLVMVRGAQVYYAEEVPPQLRSANPAKSLRTGTEVRVLAEEDGRGRWRARQIEILRLAPVREADGHEPRDALPSGSQPLHARP